MKKAAISRIFILISLFVLVMNLIIVPVIFVSAQEGPITIYGCVYDSDGKGISRGFDGEGA